MHQLPVFFVQVSDCSRSMELVSILCQSTEASIFFRRHCRARVSEKVARDGFTMVAADPIIMEGCKCYGSFQLKSTPGTAEPLGPYKTVRADWWPKPSGPLAACMWSWPSSPRRRLCVFQCPLSACIQLLPVVLARERVYMYSRILVREIAWTHKTLASRQE
jgi:hypothetical protein